MSKKVYIPSLTKLFGRWFHQRRSGAELSSTSVLFETLNDRLLERLDGLKLDPTRIIDIGWAPLHSAKLLKRRFPSATVQAVFSPLSGLAHRRWSHWRDGIEAIEGDPLAIEVEPHSIDLVFASGLLAIHTDHEYIIKRLRDWLKPQGLLLISTLGPDTLASQRLAVSLPAPNWMDVQGLGSLLSRFGFNEPVLDTDWLTMRYQTHAPLWADITALVDLNGPDDSLRTRAQIQLGKLSVPMDGVFEVVSASAFAPDEGQTLITPDGTIASIGIDQIGHRKR